MSESKKSLYVGCALTHAPEVFKQDVEDVIATLEEDYRVLKFVGSKPAPPAEVYSHDIRCVEAADAMLAIVDYPSLGLGWELATAGSLAKPTLAVARFGREVSRMILGAAEVLPAMGFGRYEDLRELPDRLDTFLAGRSESVGR